MSLDDDFRIRQVLSVGARFCCWARWAQFFIPKNMYCSIQHPFTSILPHSVAQGRWEWPWMDSDVHVTLSYLTQHLFLCFVSPIDYKNIIYLPKEVLAFLGSVPSYIQCIKKKQNKKTTEPGGSARGFVLAVVGLEFAAVGPTHRCWVIFAVVGLVAVVGLAVVGFESAAMGSEPASLLWNPSHSH